MDKIFRPVIIALIDNSSAYSEYLIHSTEYAYEFCDELWETYKNLRQKLLIDQPNEVYLLRVHIYLLVQFLGRLEN